MRKVTVYADIDHRDDVLHKLEEVGLPFFQFTECVVKASDRRPSHDDEDRELHIEMLIEAHEVEDILRTLNERGIKIDSKRIAISEVFASPVYEGSPERRASPLREIKWGDYLITV
jgi:vacuolar-type H+-ATPase subunit I/STV1